MSGGAWEFVMAVLADSSGAPRSGNTQTYNSGFNGTLGDGSKYSSGINFPAAKYYDLYTSTNPSSNDSSLSATACGGGICYGHSLSETAGWYRDSSYFVIQLSPWFVRGGIWSDAASAGGFSFNYSNGRAGNGASRAVLVPEA